MTWFKVDDSFHAHPKVLATDPAALGLWVVAGAWSSANLTEGFVPDHALPRLLPDSEPLARKLVTTGLWRRVRGGYRFHDWTDYNPTREEAAAGKKKMSGAGTLGAHRRWHIGTGRVSATCRYCFPPVDGVWGSHQPHETPSSWDEEPPYEDPMEGYGVPDGVPDTPEALFDTPTAPDQEESDGDAHGVPHRVSHGVPQCHPNAPDPTRPEDKTSTSPATPATDGEDFTRFWNAYPRRVGKGQARKAWAKALRTATASEIIAGAERYARERQGQDPKFTAHPATWLHGERWDDHPYAAEALAGNSAAWWDN